VDHRVLATSARPVQEVEEILSKLQAGDPAPDFTLLDQDGESFSLSSVRGRQALVYFYPKADTPGCTTESCAFRDKTDTFTDANAVIVGVSPDTSQAQAKFKAKFSLPFTLLADSEHKAAEDYGVWKEKSMYGKKYMGVERTTFVIDSEGIIKKVFPKVKIDGHVAEVLASVK
jgi:peroxiredoxin Q/BCP